jgi:predicted dehydrogenase
LGSTGNIGVGDPGSLELRVFCEHGHLKLEQIDGSMTVRYEDGREEHYDPLPAGTTYPQEETSNNLVQVVLGRQPNYSPGEVGMRVVELLDAAYRSAAEDGKPFSVDSL